MTDVRVDGQARASSQQHESSTTAAEPIAIIGIGCRFPGEANGPQAYWDFLNSGQDAVTEVPADRWRVEAYFNPDHRAPGRTYARWGGFIRDIDQFDAAYFGISPREAARMDPQQRLLLEVVDEAFQDAALPPDTLAGSRTGVFMGVSTSDYAGIQTASAARNSIDSFTNLGVGACIAANRISYHYDFHGPSFVVDTACSSSLVAISQACKALWNGECGVAVTGAVNLILRPENTIGFSKAQMLSPQGRCKSFDADASGYVRAEGAGAVILKPLGRAQADGDRIYAVIRAADINQDGRTGGMALPNGEAQAGLLREVYTRAGLDPRRVRYVEAHGTGTTVGDPIEVNAIGQVLRAAHQADDPECLIGSVKSNLGHLEAASGLAGLIKAALSIYHGKLPANLHFSTPNPAIPFEQYGLKVVDTPRPWPTDPDGTQSFLTGINSFGFGGTNAHTVLDRAPADPDRPTSAPDAGARAELVPFSARSADGLHAVARTYLAVLDGQPELSLSSLATALGRWREHHPYRLSVAPRTVPELREHLQAYLDGETRPGMAQGRILPEGTPTVPKVFVFSGMGPQWWAMGRDLLGMAGGPAEPVFRDTITEIDALLAEHTGWSLLAELLKTEDGSRINETFVAQPAIFAVQVGLARLWQSWGIAPDLVIGHSLGEVAAAHVAGILTLLDAVHLIYQRSRLQHTTSGQGRMLAVSMPPERAAALVDQFPDRVSIAAINSPTDVTLAGVTADLETIAARLTAEDTFNQFLQVEVPFHSPVMEQVRREFFEVMQGLVPRPPVIPMVSTTTGRFVEGAELDVRLWWGNLRQSVLFQQGMEQILALGPHAFIEISAHPVLATSMGRCIAASQQVQTRTQSVVVPSLRRREPERVTLLGSVGQLYALGVPLDWDRLHQNRVRKGELILPLYPWQHERHWNEAPRAWRERLGLKRHPLLGEPLDSAQTGWENALDAYSTPDLRDHVVQGLTVFPGAGYVEMMLAAAREVQPEAVDTGGIVLEDVQFAEALLLPPGEGRVVQTLLDARQHVRIVSRAPNAPDPTDDGLDEWTQHARATVRPAAGRHIPRQPLDELCVRCPREYDTAAFYARFHGLGLQYGPHYRGLSEVRLGRGEALGTLRPVLAHEDGLLPPQLLDACFQLLLGALASLPGVSEDRLYLPVQIRELVFMPGTVDFHRVKLHAHATLTQADSLRVSGDLRLMDGAGNVLVQVHGLSCQAIEAGSAGLDTMLYAYTWERQPLDAGHAASAPLPLPDRARLSAARDDLLGRLGADRAEFEEQSARLAERYAHAEPAEPTEEQWRAMWARFPAYGAELQLLHHAGTRQEGELRGALDHLYTDAPTSRVGHTLLHGALRDVLLGGDGTGSVLVLNAERCLAGAHLTSLLNRPGLTITLAGAEADALERAAAQFGSPAPATLLLNPGVPLPNLHFDIIVGQDALEPSALAGLLNPGGVLLLNQPVRRPAWLELVPGVMTEAPFQLADLQGLDEVGTLPDSPTPESALRVVVWGRRRVDAPETGTAGVQIARRPAGGRWLVFADDPDVAAALQAQLGDVQVICPEGQTWPGARPLRPSDRTAATALVTSALAGPSWQGVVFAWGLNPPAEPSLTDVQHAESIGGQSVLALAQALSGLTDAPPLTVVTRGTQAVHVNEAVQPFQAALWGLARVIGVESPQLKPRVIDLDARATPQDAAALLVQELVSGSTEDEVAYRHGERFVHRLRRPSVNALTGSAESGATSAYRLTVPRPGVLGSAAFEQRPRVAPQRGEVEVRIQAAALNFKDVMVALGMLPEEALEGGFTGRAYGMEAAGTVARVGEGVTDFAVGDRVVLCGADALSTYRTVPLGFVVRCPEHLSAEAAATLPIAFLTAYYALHTLGGLNARDRVLIHAAAGGVGLAAIALCQRAGATIYATAGTPEKRELLRALGVQHVFDSRSLAFAEEIRDVTAGRGVTLVLNSLSGEAIGRSLATLAPYGKFIEIGKRDIYQNSPLDLAPFRNNLSYFAVDLDRMWVDRPELMGELLDTVMGLFARRELAPLTYRAFPYLEAESALRFMAQAKHTGKVVLSLDAETVPPPERVLRVPEALHLHADGVYVITGGLGGFGLALAAWLTEHGARRLVLVGRSAGTPAAQQAVQHLREEAAVVDVVRADITHAPQVADVLTRARAMGPLRGIFHAAMVIDDALMEVLTPERYARVTAPKVLGAWNLHTQTLGDDLDVFLNFSSVSAQIGNLGQANYAAANAVLDALADRRRALGLAGFTVNWGAVADAGYLTGAAAVADRLEAVGVTPVPVRQLLAALGRLWPAVTARDTTPPVLGVAALHWPLLARSRGTALPPRLAHLQGADPGEAGGEGGGFLATLLALGGDEREQRLSSRVAEQLARILGTSPGKLDHDQAIMKMGVDSLMAVELGSQIQAETGVKVSPMKFVGGITLRGLTALVLDGLNVPVEAPAPVNLPPTDGVEVDALTGEQVDALLAELLGSEAAEP
ncbi:type I polyketide synthase [Deinococcus sp. KSM4-11]|uniref:type I polyketide synthase n=1 Tax=Deinococcus sp. KSM4-11 TaxID=2568654 RepID=UPI001454CC6C|nr:type I polyketide synthase [Deinococcus sp. KSM4-11]